MTVWAPAHLLQFRGNVDPSCYGIPTMGSYDDVRSPLKVAEDAIMGGGAER